jgi:hemoglobin
MNSATLYERLGGTAAIEATVTEFYRRVLADPLLAPFFEGIDQARLERHQARFLSYAFGGAAPYSGAGMAQAHSRLVREHGLNDLHFDAVIAHLEQALIALRVPSGERAQVRNAAESLRPLVLAGSPETAAA